MEVAVDENGSPVRAEAGASGQVVCPLCGGPMVLRRRKRSSRPGDVTYFWRHQDNTHLHCPAHYSPGNKVGRIHGKQSEK
jgi:hypothetical protein